MISNTIQETVKSTGEIIELDISTPEKVLEAYRLTNEQLEAYDNLKKQLQVLAAEIKDADPNFEHDGYTFRVYSTQRQQYDKAALREVFDEDTLDLFLEPAKGKIDKYLAAHLDELGDGSTKLRETMVPIGKPYSVVRLERLV